MLYTESQEQPSSMRESPRVSNVTSLCFIFSQKAEAGSKQEDVTINLLFKDALNTLGGIQLSLNGGSMALFFCCFNCLLLVGCIF